MFTISCLLPESTDDAIKIIKYYVGDKMIEIGKRITKFRVWNKEVKTMDYNGGVLYDLFDFHDCKYLCLNRFILDISCQFDLTQFTGAHDKEGREIYEGDLIKWREQIDKDESVKRNDNIFGLILWDREECRFIVSQITKGTWTYKVGDSLFEHDIEFYSYGGEEFDWNELEVIGNIYENPDLYKDLKEEKCPDIYKDLKERRDIEKC